MSYRQVWHVVVQENVPTPGMRWPPVFSRAFPARQLCYTMHQALQERKKWPDPEQPAPHPSVPEQKARDLYYSTLEYSEHLRPAHDQKRPAPPHDVVTHATGYLYYT